MNKAPDFQDRTKESFLTLFLLINRQSYRTPLGLFPEQVPVLSICCCHSHSSNLDVGSGYLLPYSGTPARCCHSDKCNSDYIAVPTTSQPPGHSPLRLGQCKLRASALTFPFSVLPPLRPLAPAEPVSTSLGCTAAALSVRRMIPSALGQVLVTLPAVPQPPQPGRGLVSVLHCFSPL